MSKELIKLSSEDSQFLKGSAPAIKLRNSTLEPMLYHQMGLVDKANTSKSVYKMVNDLIRGGHAAMLNNGVVDKIFDEDTLVEMSDHGYRKIVAVENIVDDVEELAKFLDEDAKKIKKLLTEGVEKHYTKYFIPKKSGGRRTIEAPSEYLKRLQHKILHRLLYKFSPCRHAHGFIKGRSILTNATEHKGNKYLLKVDLYNYFPSITGDMLRGAILPILKSSNIRFIEPLIQLCLLDGRLPQGAPTSPAWSNIAMILMDFAMIGLSRKLGATYTRYADDLCFSTDNKNYAKMLPIVRKIVESFGLSLNAKKTGFFNHGRRMTVTGLVVNDAEHVSVPRKRRMIIRAKIHNIITGKTPLSDVNYPQLNGEVAFIAMANPNHAAKFIPQFNIVREMLGIPVKESGEDEG